METKNLELIMVNISGYDRPGVTAALTAILAKYNADILDIGQADIHHYLSLGILFKTDSSVSGDIMKELLDGKTAYCLRHTFATICQQYVRPDIVDIWMGDSPTRLVGRVYTHFPDEFMLENMLNVEFPIK